MPQSGTPLSYFRPEGTKEFVFQILLTEFPLTVSELTVKIKDRFHVTLTYQAVRKAVSALVTAQVLLKQDKTYSINKNWLLQTKATIDELLLCYERGAAGHTFNENLATQGYSTYTARTLFELDNFWGETLLDLSKEYDPKETNCIHACWHYAWWMVINLGQETNLFRTIQKRGYHVYQRIFSDTPLNRWAAKIYNDIGVKTTISKGPKLDEQIAYNFIGDHVIQAHVSESALVKIRDIFRRCTSIQELKSTAITELAHDEQRITFTVFKNAEIAHQLKSIYF
jgi:hypothetical protein